MPVCEGTQIYIHTHTRVVPKYVAALGNTSVRAGYAPSSPWQAIPPPPIPTGEILPTLVTDNAAGARAPLLTLLLAASEFPLPAL